MSDRRMAYETYRKRTEIPRGLDYLAERLVRAVIRVQPKNVREFAAEFFEGLLQQRDETSKSRSPSSEEKEFASTKIDTVVVTHQPNKSKTTDDEVEAAGQSTGNDGNDIAGQCNDFDKHTLEDNDDNRSIHYVEATAVRTLAANTGSVAILGTTAKCKSVDGSPVVHRPLDERQQTWSPSTPITNSESQPQLETRYVQATAVRTLAAETGSIAILGTTADPKSQSQNPQTEKDVADSKSVHYVEATAVRHLAAETGSIAILASTVTGQQAATVEDDGHQSDCCDLMPEGVLEVLDSEPIRQQQDEYQEEPQNEQEEKRQLKQQKEQQQQQQMDSNPLIPLPVIYAMEKKPDSIEHVDSIETMSKLSSIEKQCSSQAQPTHIVDGDDGNGNGMGRSVSDTSRKQLVRQSNETSEQRDNEDVSTSNAKAPMFAKCPPAKSKSLPCRNSTLADASMSTEENSDRQHIIRGLSLPHDTDSIKADHLSNPDNVKNKDGLVGSKPDKYISVEQNAPNSNLIEPNLTEPNDFKLSLTKQDVVKSNIMEPHIVESNFTEPNDIKSNTITQYETTSKDVKLKVDEENMVGQNEVKSNKVELNLDKTIVENKNNEKNINNDDNKVFENDSSEKNKVESNVVKTIVENKNCEKDINNDYDKIVENENNEKNINNDDNKVFENESSEKNNVESNVVETIFGNKNSEKDINNDNNKIFENEKNEKNINNDDNKVFENESSEKNNVESNVVETIFGNKNSEKDINNDNNKIFENEKNEKNINNNDNKVFENENSEKNTNIDDNKATITNDKKTSSDAQFVNNKVTEQPITAVNGLIDEKIEENYGKTIEKMVDDRKIDENSVNRITFVSGVDSVETTSDADAEYRLTMIQSVREAVNRICEQAVEKTAAIVKSGRGRPAFGVNTASSLRNKRDADDSEAADYMSSDFSLPPPPPQSSDLTSTGQESSWPPPPPLSEAEEERTIAPGFSFDLPDPPTEMDQLDSETEKLDISDEEMKATLLPSDEDERADTETDEIGDDEDKASDNEDTADMKSTSATNGAIAVACGGGGGGDDDASNEPARSTVTVGADSRADDRAATTIQAVYRGFRARKYVEAVNAAAVKIQAGFRGYRVRQSLKNAAPPSTATTTTTTTTTTTDDNSQCWSDDDQKSVVSVTYAPLKEYECSQGPEAVQQRGGNDNDNNNDDDDDDDDDDNDNDNDNDDSHIQTGDDELFEHDGSGLKDMEEQATDVQSMMKANTGEPKTPEKHVPDDEEELTNAAVKIQARVRGFAARKRLIDQKNVGSVEKK